MRRRSLYSYAALGLLAALAILHCGPVRLPPPSGDAAVRDVQRNDASPSLAMGRVRDCDTRFVYPLGRQSGAVFVGGSFNSWSANALRTMPSKPLKWLSARDAEAAWCNRSRPGCVPFGVSR